MGSQTSNNKHLKEKFYELKRGATVERRLSGDLTPLWLGSGRSSRQGCSTRCALTPTDNNYQTWKYLWRQIPSSTINQLLPTHFKAKLLAYLSHFCSVSFCLTYHTCYLNFLGISQQEVQQLLKIQTPIDEIDIEADLFTLERADLEQLNQLTVEQSLLRCAVFMFLKNSQAQECRNILKQFLGSLIYNQLVTFLSNIKFCHQWIESYPELFPKEELDTLFSLAALIEREKALAEFFPNHAQLLEQNFCNKNKADECQENGGSSTYNLSELEHWINALPDQIFVVERNSQRILFCNDIFAQRLGFNDCATIKGKTIVECFGKTLAQNLDQHHQSVFISGQPLQIKESFTLNNQVYHWDTVKIPLKESNGQVYAVISTSRNITQLIKNEQVLSAQQVQLETINKELESFSYTVSHDLQAPLQVIDGFSQILLKDYQEHLDEKGQYYLQRIRANSQRMGELIENLLKLSRINRSPVYYQSVNLSAIASAIATQLKTTAPEREVQFIITPDLKVTGDYQLLTIVLENLLNNAWKYTSHHPTAVIEFGYCLQDDGTKAYFVRDDGAGFDMTYAHKLFEAFGRLHHEREFFGHGIGLATVQRIIDRHEGRIWAEGAVEQGATFYLSLPCPTSFI